ncbi:preprotein translocase, SecY subunit [Spirochaeta thermophila DSM 6578]|uniref:Protein translocase subunit SecY n=1 Tax=Winmispira thermophila (strain ATCC 700085 / DSM 6578 / Z-1203) TaxID=869211 RepID=G0G9R8_WINT7|nr:preprotein translocase subunit SecY [Spirochaeta thermophila]AEJ60818.1 preprotein translocase, SecY subunit [Spirochaeta thermophila DSM 6578]
MASNPISQVFRIPELRKRVLFTLTVLIVFRIGAALPIPGINITALKQYYLQQQTEGLTSITDYIDFFAGGAFKNFSIFMLGVMPYITASIIMQLLLVMFPSLKAIAEEEGGRKKIQRYTRYGTVLVSLIQSFIVAQYADAIPDAVVLPKLSFVLLGMLTVTTGSLFLMWLGEQVNQRGIGNGISLIIFAGIVARLPQAFIQLVEQIQLGELNPVVALLVLVLFVAVIILVIYEQQGQRKIPVHYAKRVVGRRVYGVQNTYIPMKLNPSGVIPVIFASSVLLFPLQIAQMLGTRVGWLADVAYWLRPGGVWYLVFYTLLIIFFAYFYTQVTLNPMELAKNIREHGGSVPGVRAEKLEEYFTNILNRIILPGALFLAFIAIIPTLVQQVFHFPSRLAYLMGGTSLLIMVGVDLDTMSQIEGHLKMHHQDGLVRRGKLRARNL